MMQPPLNVVWKVMNSYCSFWPRACPKVGLLSAINYAYSRLQAGLYACAHTLTCKHAHTETTAPKQKTHSDWSQQHITVFLAQAQRQAGLFFFFTLWFPDSAGHKTGYFWFWNDTRCFPESRWRRCTRHSCKRFNFKVHFGHKWRRWGVVRNAFWTFGTGEMLPLWWKTFFKTFSYVFLICEHHVIQQRFSSNLMLEDPNQISR